MSQGFNVVLVEPEIPNNTGNIGRLCVATRSRLHLVHPLGFEISDSRVKRAGLDYWPELALYEYPSMDELMSQIPEDKKMFFLSSHAEQSFYREAINPGDWLIFGKESTGLGEEIRAKYSSRLFKIPFQGKVRSFNLANTVAMTLGEGMRQCGF